MTTDRLMLVWIVAALVGCSAPPSARQAVASWDSAGVRVVLNRHPNWAEGQGWVFSSASPVLFQGPMDLHDGVILSDGTVVGLDRDAKTLHVFAPTGELIRSVGGEGSGPGEYREPTALAAYRGDSVVVFDRSLGRATVLSNQGEADRFIPVRVASPWVDLLGTLEDGSIAVLAGAFTPRDGIWRDTSALIRVTADGSVQDTVAVVPGTEFYSVMFRGSRQFGIRPFGHNTIGAAARGVLAINRGDACTVDIYGPSHDLAMRVRSPCSRVPVTDEMIETDEARQLAGFRSEEARQFAAAFYDAGLRPYPDSTAPYSRVLVDSSGHVWVGRYVQPGSASRQTWAVFDRDGRLLGNVPSPQGFRMIQVRGTTALGQVVDTLGRSYLVLRGLSKGGR